MNTEELLQALAPCGAPAEAWWPSEGPFETAVGAILVQGVAWRNVERALSGLRAVGLLAPGPLGAAPRAEVEQAVRPALYFHQKAGYLQSFAGFVLDRCGGDLLGLQGLPPEDQRRALLSVRGIGAETAAAIMVYALGAAVTVLDAYALRVLPRVGASLPGDRAGAEAALRAAVSGEAQKARLLHARIVALAQEHCRKEPQCAGCPLLASCPRLVGKTVAGRRRNGQGTADGDAAQGAGGVGKRTCAETIEGRSSARTRALG